MNTRNLQYEGKTNIYSFAVNELDEPYTQA